jgi:adenosylcobinamide-GDP ribazoletransferase
MEGLETDEAYLPVSVVGAIIGLLLAVIGYALSLIFPPGLTSIILIISIYFLTGINHIDALADFGDGVAAHALEKRSSDRDTAVGTEG